jgi:hypothetical protein
MKKLIFFGILVLTIISKAKQSTETDEPDVTDTTEVTTTTTTDKVTEVKPVVDETKIINKDEKKKVIKAELLPVKKKIKK